MKLVLTLACVVVVVLVGVSWTVFSDENKRQAADQPPPGTTMDLAPRVDGIRSVEHGRFAALPLEPKPEGEVSLETKGISTPSGQGPSVVGLLEEEWAAYFALDFETAD